MIILIIWRIVLVCVLVPTLQIPITYGFSSRIMKFSETILTQSASVPHYNHSMILYCLTSISIRGYFSYTSWHNVTTKDDKHTLTISVEITGTNTFTIGISYIYMESMPNMEIAQINLTHTQRTQTFNSSKHLAYDENTYLSAHLTGFSSSKLTYRTYYHTSKFNTTYAVYTQINLLQGEWVSLSLVILQDNYDMNGSICIGSYINSQSNVSSVRSPLRLDIQPQLHFILGLQTFVLANAQFLFNRSTNSIIMNETGTYSFSIIVINNTCNYVFDTQAYEQAKQQHLYLILMIISIVIFVGLLGSLIIYFKNRRRCDIKLRNFILRKKKSQKNRQSIPRIAEQKSVIMEENPNFTRKIKRQNSGKERKEKQCSGNLNNKSLQKEEQKLTYQNKNPLKNIKLQKQENQILGSEDLFDLPNFKS